MRRKKKKTTSRWECICRVLIVVLISKLIFEKEEKIIRNKKEQRNFTIGSKISINWIHQLEGKSIHGAVEKKTEQRYYWGWGKVIRLLQNLKKVSYIKIMLFILIWWISNISLASIDTMTKLNEDSPTNTSEL